MSANCLEDFSKLLLSFSATCRGEFLEKGDGFIKTDASVGDTLAINHVWPNLLGSFDEEAFDHDTHYSVVRLSELIND